MWAGLWIAVCLAVSPEMSAARRWYDALDYPRAQTALSHALEMGSLAEEERLEARDLLARCLVAQGKTDEAVEVYVDLLREVPDAPEPVGAPKLRETFARARFRVAPTPAKPPIASIRPAELVSAPLVTPSSSSARHWVRWSVVGLSVVSAVVGTVFAVSSSMDSLRAGQASRAVETARWDDQAISKAWAAHAFLGGAALGGATAGILWWQWN